MFDEPYKFQYLGIRNTLVPDPTLKANYRFQAKNRRYLVTFETYSFNVVAVKYCDIKDRNAGNRYDKIFNDGDAFRVITTCLYTMLDFWKRNPQVTFSFYAVPRHLDTHLFEQMHLDEKQWRKFVDRYRKVRYAIYDYAMINLFPPRHFTPLRDRKNSVYLLMNKKQRKPKTTVKRFGQFLLDNYGMIFEPDE